MFIQQPISIPKSDIEYFDLFLHILFLRGASDFRSFWGIGVEGIDIIDNIILI